MNFKTFSLILGIILNIKFLLCEEIVYNQTDYNEDGSVKIVGGQVSEIENAPYLAQLRYTLYFRCGGSIISEFWILSAAHCLVDRDLTASKYDIRTGSSRKSRGGKLTAIEYLLPHPSFNEAVGYDGDVMLIKLAKKLIFTDRQRPIKLASASKNIPTGTELLATGFGDTKNIKESNQLLRAVIVKVTDFNACKETYLSKNYQFTDNMLCAGVSGGGKDTCQVKIFKLTIVK